VAIPILLYAVSATQALPIAAVLVVRGRHPPTPYRRLVVFCLALLITDILSIALGRAVGNNRWLAYGTEPMEVALTLWLLEAWQPNAFLRLAYSVTIVLMGATVAGTLMLTDPQVTFGQWISPFLALLALAATLHTLVHRVLLSRLLLTNQDWFWVCLGLALFWLTFVPFDPFLRAFMPERVDWARAAYYFRFSAMSVSFLLMSWGIVCQRRLVLSPGRS
jgi:hypothetical protein